MSSEPVDNRGDFAPPEEPRHVRQVVVATDDRAVVEAIELCLFDNEIQARVIPWRDMPAHESESPLAAVANLAAHESRLLAVAAEYIRLARDTHVTGGDPCRALDWAEEALQRAAEMNEGWRRIAEVMG